MHRREALKSLSVISFFSLISMKGITADLTIGSTEIKFKKLINEFTSGKNKPIAFGELIAEIGLKFLGTPYIGGTLESSNGEECIINFNGLDCVTFYENCLGLARILKKNKSSMDDLRDEITFTRYRTGKLQGYLSRLHYTSDWIFDNEKKGVIKNITKTLNPDKFPVNLFFMSKNPNFYPQLKSNPKDIEVIAGIENEINSRPHYFVPKDRIVSIENKIQTGDYIAIATNKKGLDYAHVGTAYVKNNKTHFLHASLKQKKVVLDTTISEYVNSVSTHIGITVARPLMP